MLFINKGAALSLALYGLLLVTYKIHSQTLDLKTVISIAQQNDPWLASSQHKQNANLAKSMSANSMADPTISISMANIPVDSWQFNQENMSQLKFAISQQLPRGSSLRLKQDQQLLSANKQPLLRESRRAQVKVAITSIWLDAFLAKQTILLIQKDRALFEQMVEIANASYSSAAGKTRQQEVIRAQLELLRLDDKLVQQKQVLNTAIAKLNSWLIPSVNKINSALIQVDTQEILLPLPAFTLQGTIFAEPGVSNQSDIIKILLRHPTIVNFDQDIAINQKSVELSEQSYQPQFTLTAGYAIRSDNHETSRSDLLSMGVNFDLPLFTSNKQDKDLQAAKLNKEASKTDKQLMIKNMLIEISGLKTQLEQLNQRATLYRKSLLPQSHEHAEASLTAYTNNIGDFSEVMRARIAELNSKIEAGKIKINQFKIISQLQYYLTQTSSFLEVEYKKHDSEY